MNQGDDLGDRDDLSESLRHLEYEMAMMVAAPRMLAEHPLDPAKNTDRPPGYYWANDRAVAYLAALESACTHARVLDDFFRYASGDEPTKGRWANDRYAAHYCEQNGWPGYRVLTEDQYTAISQQLSHLTTQRRFRKEHPVGLFSNLAVNALVALTGRADPQWQGPLEDILNKTVAERERMGDSWNPS